MDEAEYLVALAAPPAEGIPSGGPVALIPRGYGAGVDHRLAQGTVPFNVWLATQSTNVRAIRFDPWPDIESEFGRLYVEFLSLAMYRYDGLHYSMFDQMLQSPSKGQFVVYRLSLWQSRHKLRGAQRVVTQAMKDANYGRVAL